MRRSLYVAAPLLAAAAVTLSACTEPSHAPQPSATGTTTGGFGSSFSLALPLVVMLGIAIYAARTGG